MVVVREPNGILRHADHVEREKMMNVYFHPDKPNYTPKMFEPINLEVRFKWPIEAHRVLFIFVFLFVTGMSKR